MDGRFVQCMCYYVNFAIFCGINWYRTRFYAVDAIFPINIAGSCLLFLLLPDPNPPLAVDIQLCSVLFTVYLSESTLESKPPRADIIRSRQ